MRKFESVVLLVAASSSTRTTVPSGSAVNDGASLTGVISTEKTVVLTCPPPLPTEPRSLTVRRIFCVPKKLVAGLKVNSSKA